MANPGLSSEGFGGDAHSFPEQEEEHGELKALIDAIASQLSDATRRHSETLNEMQDTVATMGREAEALRDHIPEQFAPSFEHIEAGVAQLAQRLAKAGVAGTSEQPSGPWDATSAEALNQVYESDARPLRNPAPAPYAASQPAGASLGQAWFEDRFSEIARGIEQSLAEIRPDRSLRAIEERLDQFEQKFSRLLGSVATRADLDAVRLIEEHVGEVVNHLVQTHDQLLRLNAIEEQLATITRTLSGETGHEGSHLSSAASIMPGINVDAIAQAVAEQAATRFSGMTTVAHDPVSELRPLIERMIEESRSGGENTVAVLDTVQQAMIRLLDRVDALEFAQRDNAPMRSTSYDTVEVRDHDLDPPFPAPPTGDFTSAATTSVPPPIPDELEAEFIEHSYSFAREEPVETVVGTTEKLRQDFIADARRAKMRLSAGSDDDLVVTSAPDPSLFTMSSADAPRGAPQGGKPIRPVAARSKASGPSGPSPRLIVLAVATILALGGLWFTSGTDAQKPTAIPPSAQPAASDVPGSAAGARSDAGNSDTTDGPARASAGDQQGQSNPVVTGSNPTDLSMLGVSVDLNAPATPQTLQQAQRHQAMAAMSGKLGDAATRDRSAAAVPASMVPTEAETEGVNGTPKTDALAAGSVSAPRFELPVATVGPLSLRLAAANGDPSAEFEVGARLAEGKGTPQNFNEAAKWYQRSADQGLAQAQYRLGTFYERGLGVKADRALAEAWYKRAADQGNVKAMHNLAVLSANQTVQSPDYVTAAQWFEQAAKYGLADSQFNLAILCENGLGVKKDMQQAYMWISLAARNNDAEAVRRKSILRGKLTANELEAAETMIKAWRPSAVNRSVNDARVAGEEWKRNPKNGVAG